jgi:hypothetical protein
MNLSDALRPLKLQYALRGDPEYTAELSLNDVDIEFLNGSVAPTDAELHAAARLYKTHALLEEYKQAIKGLLAEKARSKDYDSEQSIASYAVSTNLVWKREAQQYIEWRDTVWSYAYDVLARVESNKIEPPSIEDFIDSAPKLKWSE